MKVKDFIIKNGISELQGKSIFENGKEYKISLENTDIDFHSLNNEDWKGSKARMDGYHERGNYRFYAVCNENRAVWVYPSTELYEAPKEQEELELKGIFNRIVSFRDEAELTEQDREIIIDIETTLLDIIRRNHN